MDWRGVGPDGTLTFGVVRCGLGVETNDGIDVYVRHKVGRSPRLLSNIPVAQAWHNDDKQVTYQMDFDFLDKTLPPSHPGRLNPAKDLMVRQFLAATDRYNALHPGAFQGSSSDPDTRPTVTTTYRCDRNELGCVQKQQAQMYPHITKQLFWMSQPPAYKAGYEWTTDLIKAKIPMEKKYYLPLVMMHEVGHLLGLGHLPSGEGIMSGYNLGAYTGPGLSVEDKHGLAQVFGTHTHSP